MTDWKSATTIAERLRILESWLKRGAKHQEILDHHRRLMATVDAPGLEALRAQYADRIKKASADSRYKYFDVAFYTLQKLQLAYELGLDGGAPQRVLDIGTGAGHFPFVCRGLGHEVVAVDIENPVYQGIASCLGVERTIARVKPESPLPALGGKFDLILACNIAFDEIRTRDRQSQRRYWSMPEWQFFLDDLLVNQLRYPGRLYLKLNQQRRGRFLGYQCLAYNHRFLAMASHNGATVSHWYGTVDLSLSTPREISLRPSNRQKVLSPWLWK